MSDYPLYVAVAVVAFPMVALLVAAVAQLVDRWGWWPALGLLLWLAAYACLMFHGRAWERQP